MIRRYTARCGFSLLELMVVIMIIGLISGVVAASFSGGIKVWESASILTSVEQEAYFSAENMRRDLANTFAFHDLGFKGEANSVSLPGLVPIIDKEGETRLRIGTVKYLHDPSERSLCRLTWPYPGEEDSADWEIIAENIESIQFKYLKPDLSTEDGWIESWQIPTNFPAAVGMELSISNRGQNIVVYREIPLTEALWRKD